MLIRRILRFIGGPGQVNELSDETHFVSLTVVKRSYQLASDVGRPIEIGSHLFQLAQPLMRPPEDADLARAVHFNMPISHRMNPEKWRPMTSAAKCSRKAAIHSHMELFNLPLNALADVLGSSPRATKVLTKRCALAVDLIFKINKARRIPAELNLPAPDIERVEVMRAPAAGCDSGAVAERS